MQDCKKNRWYLKLDNNHHYCPLLDRTDCPHKDQTITKRETLYSTQDPDGTEHDLPRCTLPDKLEGKGSENGET